MIRKRNDTTTGEVIAVTDDQIQKDDPINRSIVKEAAPPTVKVADASTTQDLSNTINWSIEFDFTVRKWVEEQSKDIILSKAKSLLDKYKDKDLPADCY